MLSSLFISSLQTLQVNKNASLKISSLVEWQWFGILKLLVHLVLSRWKLVRGFCSLDFYRMLHFRDNSVLLILIICISLEDSCFPEGIPPQGVVSAPKGKVETEVTQCKTLPTSAKLFHTHMSPSCVLKQ